MEVNPEQGMQPAFTNIEKAVYLRKLFYTSVVTLLVSIAGIVYSYFAFQAFGYIEYIITLVINTIVVVLAAVDILWANRTPAHLIIDPNQDQDKYLDQSQTMTYIHTCGSQCCLAAEIAILYNLIQFNAFKATPWLFFVQLLITLLLVFAVYVGYMYCHHAVGQKRLTIYVSISACLVVCLISSMYLKQFILETNLQVYQISPLFCESIKYFLLIIVTYLVVVAFVNHRRLKVLFTPVAYVLMVLLICGMVHNGLYVREVQQNSARIYTDQGCRDTMSLISQTSLKGLGCADKYKSYAQSPYLPCPESQQGVMWEQDKEKLPADKLNTLACLNMNCCRDVEVNVSNTAKALACWLNIFLWLAFVCASNALMLSRTPFKMFQMRIYADLVVLIILAALIFFILGIVYSYVPHSQFEVKPTIVAQSNTQLTEVTVLPYPNYKNFKMINSFNNRYNFGNCQLIQTLLLQPITFNDASSTGYRVGISAQQGNFLIQQAFNAKGLMIIDNNAAIKEIFGEPDSQTQYMIFQGTNVDMQAFLSYALYFCSDTPLNSNIQVKIGKYQPKMTNTRLLQNKKHINNHYHNHKNRQNHVLTHFDPANIVGEQQLNAVKFFTIDVSVEDIRTAQRIQGAKVDVYVGGYFTSSCSTVTKMYQPFLSSTTDSSGSARIHNLNMGMYFTAVIQVPDYINSCIQIDFTQTNIKAPKLTYSVGVSPKLPEFSMRVILEWTNIVGVELGLQGTLNVGNTQCIVGNITNGCAGMSIERTALSTKRIQSISVDVIEPYQYLFFVTRKLSQSDAAAKLSDHDKKMNDDIEQSEPIITVYVHEVDYPVVQYKIPLMSTIQQDTLDFNWLVFCVNGDKTDTPVAVQVYWSQITNTDVTNNQGYTKRTWPSTSDCPKQ